MRLLRAVFRCLEIPIHRNLRDTLAQTLFMGLFLGACANIYDTSENTARISAGGVAPTDVLLQGPLEYAVGSPSAASIRYKKGVGVFTKHGIQIYSKDKTITKPILDVPYSELTKFAVPGEGRRGEELELFTAHEVIVWGFLLHRTLFPYDAEKAEQAADILRKLSIPQVAPTSVRPSQYNSIPGVIFLP